MKHKAVLFLAAGCLLKGAVLLLYAAREQQRTYFYEPKRASLTGKLVVRQYYGRPTYGEKPESDERENAYLLLLKDAIKVLPDKKTEMEATREEGVEEVQLVFDPARLPLDALLGKRVEIEGTLYHSFAGHHHAKVLMSVSKIRRA